MTDKQDDKNLSEFGFEEIPTEESESDLSEFGFEEAKPEESFNLDDIIDPLGTGAGIYGSQKALETLAQSNTQIGKKLRETSKSMSKVPRKTLGFVGKLDEDQLDKIASDPKFYKKSRSLEELADEYTELIKDIKTEGIKSAKKADELVEQRNLSVPKEKIEEKFAKRIEPRLISASKELEETEVPESLRRFIGEEKKILPQTLKETIEKQTKYLKKLPKELKGRELVTYLSDVTDTINSYDKELGKKQKEKLLEELRQETRDIIGLSDKEYDELKKISRKSIVDQKDMKKLLSLGKNAENELQAGAPTQRKIARIFGLSGKQFDLEKKQIQSILKDYGKSDLFTESELSSIKDYVSKNIDPLDFKGIGKSALIAHISPVLAPFVYLKENFGTKAQEALTLIGQSAPVRGATKAGKAVGKLAYKGLPLLGAGLSYEEARAEGATPPEAVGKAVAEEATDIVMPIKEALRPSQLGAKPGSLTARLEGGERLTPKEEKKIGYESSKEDIQKAKTNMPLQQKQIQRTLNDPSTLDSLIQEFDSLKNQSGEKFADQLESYKDASDQDKIKLRYSLEQQPAFRKYFREFQKKRIKE